MDTSTQNQAQPTVVAAVAFHVAIMPISITTDNKRNFDHFLEYGLATLDMVSDGFPAPDKWNTTKQTEGEGEEAVTAEISTPEYVDEQLDYLQTALTQRLQGLARSRDKASQTAIMNWQELAESGGGAKYPAQLKQFRADFLAWLQSDEGAANEAQQTALVAYTDAKTLLSVPHARKESIAVWFNKFFEFYGEKAAEIGSVVASITRAMESSIEDIEL